MIMTMIMTDLPPSECNSDDDIDEDENDNENAEDNGNFHDMKYDNDGDDKNVD